MYNHQVHASEPLLDFHTQQGTLRLVPFYAQFSESIVILVEAFRILSNRSGATRPLVPSVGLEPTLQSPAQRYCAVAESNRRYAGASGAPRSAN